MWGCQFTGGPDPAHNASTLFYIFPPSTPPVSVLLPKHRLLQASLQGVFGQVIVMKKDRGEFSREML